MFTKKKIVTDIKPVKTKNITNENNPSIKDNENDEIENISVNSDSEPEICFVMRRQPLHHNNKIILGSKPAQQKYKIEVDTENITEKIYSANVVLDDISLELRENGRFCNTCLILFPSIETLQDHQVKCHNTINELEINNQDEPITYKCEKCCKRFSRRGNWIKHVQNTHRTRIVPRVQSESKCRMLRSYRKIIRPNTNCESENKCIHCNKKFSSKKLLIEHIYTIMRSNNTLLKSTLFVNNPENITQLKDNGSKINLLRNTFSPSENRVQPRSNKRSASPAVVTTQQRGTKSSENEVKINDKIISKPLKMSVQLDKSFENAKEKTTSPCCETIHKEPKTQGKQLFYRCLYCSYYFRQVFYYLKHIHKKHKDTSKAKVNMVLFDGQCKYCSRKSSDFHSYNVHMLQYHKKNINNTFKIYPKVVLSKVEINKTKISKPDRTAPVKRSSNYNDLLDMELSELSENIRNEDLSEDSTELKCLVLKSKLFKCMRCDIHFLTVKSTKDHENHMEMLINWKCHICHKIFKKEDEASHQQQHEYSNTFTVFELDAHELKRVLYKCSKCAIHFDENDFISHFKTCEVVMAESMYCKICDILIDKCLYGDHSDEHRYKRLNLNDFTIINTDDIISTDNYIPTVESPRHVIVNSKKKRITTSKIIEKRATKKRLIKKKIDFWNTIYLKLSYCDTCKSFVTQIGVLRNVHVESRCANRKTVICKYCGLVFTTYSIRKHINGVHQQKKDLKLQDFSFYSIRTGKPILPPVPEYPKCYKCDVHFISRSDVFGHVCSENNYLTCNICNIKLYDKIFKLHMAFHYYSKSLDNNFLSDISNGSKNKEKYHQKPIPTKRQKKFADTGLSDQESESTLARKINIELNETLDSHKTTEINESVNKGDTSEDMPDANVMPNVSKENEQNKIKETAFVASNKKSDYELFNVLYCCSNCHTTIDTYDSVVEHCQDHLCGVQIKTEICKTCKMTVDHKSFRDHSVFHNLKRTRAPLTLLKFDIFYFTQGNKLWFKHVFGPFSKRKTELILYRSIYNTSRIKMDVIQEGPPDLTVYKCASCHVIVEPDSVGKHAEISCFRTRKYPCTYCGLPFLSYLARREHENIHITNNITLKSYRIVVFNRNHDKKDNKMLDKRQSSYVLYQCRNCRGIIDKYQRTTHVCIKTNLKKCESCDLLIPCSDYNAHFRKHNDVSNFCQKNMKIVVFGQNDQSKTSDVNENGQNSSSFDGIYIDYTFYKCVECEVCFDKSQLAKLKHNVCYDNSLKMKCVKCDLFILKKKMFQHNKMHEAHVEFVRENMNIIPYSPSELQANFIPADTYGTQENSNNVSLLQGTSHEKEVVQRSIANVLVDSEKHLLECEKDNNSKIEERTAKLFKCVCGLHFLDHSSIKVHLDHCHSKIAKQHCSKCRLLFTPNVLFDHLLIHHGDKKYKYDFKIVEMSKNQCDVVTLYNCVKCTINFVEYDKAITHYEVCDEMDEESTKCKKCNLFFGICSIEQHESHHHESNVADMDIVDIEKCLHSRNLYSDRENQNNIVQNTSLNGDGVIDKRKYNISDDFLASIDLSKYNNCIYKCELCNTNFLTENTHSRHFASGHNLPSQDTCHICGLRFALPSLSKHIYIHHNQMKLRFIDDFVVKYH